MSATTSGATAVRADARDAYSRYERAFADLDPPFAFVDMDALWANGDDMLRRAAGKPIRVASKSVRCREVQRRILEHSPGFRGQLCFTLSEALWLAGEGFDDLLVAYPNVDRVALGELAAIAARRGDAAPAVMVDCTEHLDLIEACGASGDAPVRVAIDIDVGWWPAGGRVKIGPKRSPIRTPAQAAALAREIAGRPALKLIGLMAYEGHIAGVGDAHPHHRLQSLGIRVMQRLSAGEIAARRGEIVAAVREVEDIELVNGGGTGSLETTAAEAAVTELAAGSGFYAPVLFDYYTHFTLTPAAMFCLPVVRKPAPGVATALGGGYLASGAGAKDRMPSPHLPPGLRLDPMEGTGEVQTPLLGDAARDLRVGDRVYFRHVKAGELCERFETLHLVESGQVVDQVPTYRGEGRCFL